MLSQFIYFSRLMIVLMLILECTAYCHTILEISTVGVTSHIWTLVNYGSRIDNFIRTLE